MAWQCLQFLVAHKFSQLEVFLHTEDCTDKMELPTTAESLRSQNDAEFKVSAEMVISYTATVYDTAVVLFTNALFSSRFSCSGVG